MEILRYLIKEAEAQGASDAEVYAATNKEAEVYLENNDLKQVKSQAVSAVGIRVLLDGSLGFYSVNRLDKDHLQDAVVQAIKIARVSPKDRFNSLPNRSKKKIRRLQGIYDKNAESFQASDAARMAAEMLDSAKSVDRRITVDSGNFTASLMAHSLANSNGIDLEEKLSTFGWSLMGMAVEDGDVSSFDIQVGATHQVKGIDVHSTANEFAETVVNSLGARKIDSFKGEMLLTPAAVGELIEEVLSHSVNSNAVQKNSSQFAGKVGKTVASELLTVEDDATNTEGLAASSFDREGVPHSRNVIIEKGALKKFLYNTYTAKKDRVRSTGNAGGSTVFPPSVSTTNFIVRPGRSGFDALVSEMKNGIIISRFSGNVNAVNGDFSGVVKGGRYVRNGSIEHPVKEVMVAGNVFDSLRRLNGVSKERRVIYDSILPYMRFGDVSFTAG